MNEIILYCMAFGALIGGIDHILGNRFGYGARFEEAFLLLDRQTYRAESGKHHRNSPRCGQCGARTGHGAPDGQPGQGGDRRFCGLWRLYFRGPPGIRPQHRTPAGNCTGDSKAAGRIGRNRDRTGGYKEAASDVIALLLFCNHRREDRNESF